MTTTVRLAQSGLSRLAGFACTLRFDAIPGRVIERAKLTFRHNLAVALAAGAEPMPGRDTVDWPAQMPREQCSTRLSDGRLAPVERAIVTNALAMGARAQHDEHPGAISHFGSTVLPPLLAAAEIGDVAGKQVLVAMVAGYEVGARVAAMSVGETARRGFRPTGIYGPFAAAAATGVALGLDHESFVSALALAGNASAGLTQTWLAGTDEWRYQTAFAGRNGFLAAQLATAGVRGAADTLEGDRGFLHAFADGAAADAGALDDLGQRWAMDSILLKPFPVCAFNQAPVQQILELRRRHRLDPGAIQAIRITMHPDDLNYPGIDVRTPVRTRPAALMCLRTCAAIAMSENDVPIGTLERPDRADIQALRDTVHLVADDRIPSHTSTVTIATAAGDVVSSGTPSGVVYDAGVQAALIARLQPDTGMSRQEFQQLLDHAQTLDGPHGMARLLHTVRNRARVELPVPDGFRRRPISGEAPSEC